VLVGLEGKRPLLAMGHGAAHAGRPNRRISPSHADVVLERKRAGSDGHPPVLGLEPFVEMELERLAVTLK
jgi:hypothetical protein